VQPLVARREALADTTGALPFAAASSGRSLGHAGGRAESAEARELTKVRLTKSVIACRRPLQGAAGALTRSATRRSLGKGWFLRAEDQGDRHAQRGKGGTKK